MSKEILKEIAEICRQYRKVAVVSDADGMVRPQEPLSWETAAMLGCDALAAIEKLAKEPV